MSQESRLILGARLEVNGLPHRFAINDIPRSFSGQFAEINALEPAPQFISSGRNELSLASFPDKYTPDHYLSVSIEYWFEGENPNTDARRAFRVSYFPSRTDSGPFVEYGEGPGLPVRPLENAIEFRVTPNHDTLVVPFETLIDIPQWCWERGEVLADTPEIRNDLAQEYYQLYSLFATQDKAALMRNASVMIDDLTQASGAPREYVQNSVSYQGFFERPEVFRLAPFPQMPLTLNLGAGNRIAWLTAEGVAEPIRFEHLQEEETSTWVSLYFSRIQGRWVLCR